MVLLRCLILTAVLGCFFLLPAQEFRATLSGRITDAQDATLARVKVVLVQIDTGAKFETVTNEEGLYTIPFLPPASYRLAAELTGFKKLERTNITLGANERIAVDLRMEIGATSETMIVTDEVPLLQTATASVGQVITSAQVDKMPLSGRTPLALAQLAFGVVPTNDPRFTRPFDNGGPAGFSMGGAPNQTNELLIDGAPDATGNNRVAYNPPMDAVAEVKAESFNVDAAYGHTGGGIVNVILKGGGNQFHGTLYEFNQNSAFNATPFFTNKAGGRKPVSRYNQYGGTVSGPIWIPKVLDGRNRVFFFFGYEGVKDALPAPTTSTVPTAAQRTGDFSALLGVGAGYQIFDPSSGVREGARVRRTGFPNNIIPASRISPIARNYLGYYPQPNQPGRNDGQDNLLSGTSGERNDFYNYISRVDVNISDRHKLFVGVRTNKRVGQGSNNLNGSLIDPITAGNGLTRLNWGIMADDVYTFTPTLLLNSRLNWTRFSEPLRNFTTGFDSSTLGFPAYLGQAASARVVPRIRFSRYTGFGDTGGTIFPFDSFQLFESLTKVLSKHTLKFGADLRQQRESQLNFGFSNGDFLFGTNWTQGPLDNAASSPLGQDLASFLLGLPTDGGLDNNTSRTNKRNYYAFFLQDDYRVRSNFTLNLGIRAERETPTTERFNRSVNGFDDGAALSIAGAARAAYAASPIPELPAANFRPAGGLTFASDANRDIYKTPGLNFSPRMGFAWTPAALGSKTVVRGGVGIYYFVLGINGANQPGFSQTTPVVASLDGFLTPNATLANPFPTGFLAPTGSSAGASTFLGRGVSFFVPEAKNPYSVRWNLSLSRQIDKNTVIEAGYMGNKAVRLPVDQQLNGVPVELLSTRPDRDQAVINQLTSNVANPYAGLVPGTALNGTQIGRNQLLRRYSQFTGVTGQSFNDGSSHFHALQARIERRFGSGLQITSNFQYSKLMEKRSRLNDLDPFLEKRIAAENRPWRSVTSGSYDMPFGRGKRFAGSINRWADLAIGEWTVNAIYTAQPGAPLTWGNVIYLGGPLNMQPHNPDISFDTTRFNRVAAQQLDWNRRTFPTRFANLRQDGVNQLDFSFIKGFRIIERVNLTYRCEFFNSTNRPIFSAPNLTPANANFGVITNQANQPRRIQMALRLVF